MTGAVECFQPSGGRALSCGVYRGVRASDGCFEHDETGPEWVGFREPEDMVFWCPSTGEVATFFNRAFALNEAAIDNPGTFALDGRLHIHATVGRWITAEGRGIFVIDWKRAYQRLKDAPRLRIDEAVVWTYQRHMVPPGLPHVLVRRDRKRGA